MTNKFRESSTFKIVLLTWMGLNVAMVRGLYVAEGATEIGDLMVSYAASCGVALAIWLGREWRVTHYKKEGE